MEKERYFEGEELLKRGEPFEIARVMEMERFTESDVVSFFSLLQDPTSLFLSITKQETEQQYTDRTIVTKLCFLLRHAPFDKRDKKAQDALATFLEQAFGATFDGNRLRMYDYLEQRARFREETCVSIFQQNAIKQQTYRQEKQRYEENMSYVTSSQESSDKLFAIKRQGESIDDLFVLLDEHQMSVEDFLDVVVEELQENDPKELAIRQYSVEFEDIGFEKTKKLIQDIEKQITVWEATVGTDAFEAPRGWEYFSSGYAAKMQRVKQYLQEIDALLVSIGKQGRENDFCMTISLGSFGSVGEEDYTIHYDGIDQTGISNSDLAGDTHRLQGEKEIAVSNSDKKHIFYDIEFRSREEKQILDGDNRSFESTITVEQGIGFSENHTGTIYFDAVDIRKRPVDNNMLCRQIYVIDIRPKTVLKPTIELYPSFDYKESVVAGESVSASYGVLPSKVVYNDKDQIYEVYFGDKMIPFPIQTTGYQGTRLAWIEAAKEKNYKSKAGQGSQTLGYDVSYSDSVSNSTKPLNTNLVRMDLLPGVTEINQSLPELRAKVSCMSIQNREGKTKYMLIVESFSPAKKLYCKEVPTNKMSLLLKEMSYETTGFRGNVLCPQPLLFGTETNNDPLFLQWEGWGGFDETFDQILGQ